MESNGGFLSHGGTAVIIHISRSGVSMKYIIQLRGSQNLWKPPYHLESNMIKGSLVRKLPNYERFSQLAVAPSCQPHHHVNHIIIK